MKLSEAIRAGCAIRPKKVGRLWGFISGTNDYGSCALGAAFEGLTGQHHFDEHKVTEFLQGKYPILDEVVAHPTLSTERRLEDIIVFLNDCAMWPREAIAEWVETVEKKLEPKPMVVPSADESVVIADSTAGEPEPGQVASPAKIHCAL